MNYFRRTLREVVKEGFDVGGGGIEEGGGGIVEGGVDGDFFLIA